MKCRKCGATLWPGEKFCTSCGTTAPVSAPVDEAPAIIPEEPSRPVAVPVDPVRAACPQCGAMLPSADAVCAACETMPPAPPAGDDAPTLIPEPPPVFEPAPVSAGSGRCPACGTALSPSDGFCTVCGAAVRGGQPAALQATPAPGAPPGLYPPAPAGSGRSILVAIVAFLIVGAVLGLVGLGGWFWRQRQVKAHRDIAVQAVQPPTEQPMAVPAPAPVPPEQASLPAQPAPEFATVAPQPPASPPVAASSPSARPKARPDLRITTFAPAEAGTPATAESRDTVVRVERAPVQPAPAEPPVAPRTETPRPAPDVPAVGYRGPLEGTIVWSGQLEKNGLITIDGSRASAGSLRGQLPGVPVMIEVQPSDVGLAETPSPSNGWKRLTLRSRVNRRSVVTIQWTVLR